MSQTVGEQEDRARRVVIDIMNIVRQKYVENRPVPTAKGENVDNIAFSDAFGTMLRQEVGECTTDNLLDEIDGDFAQ